MERNRTIITLSGKQGCGKTTISNILVKSIFDRKLVYPMASLLKNVVATVTKCKVSDLDNFKFKLKRSGYFVEQFGDIKELTYRECLLHFGKLLRFDNNNVFIDDAIATIANSTAKYIIIPDVRERRELKALIDFANENDMDIIPIRVERPNVKGSHPNDTTETDLDDYKGFQYCIMNDADINGLCDVVIQILSMENITTNIRVKEQLLFD